MTATNDRSLLDHCATARTLLLVALGLLALGCRDGGVHELDAYEGATLDVAEEFTLVTWNLHKETGAVGAEQLRGIVEDEGADVIALQEAHADLSLPERFGAHFAGSFRWVPWGAANGVMTVGRTRPANAEPAGVGPRELYVTTPKTALVTTLALSDGRSLMIVNMHALLFGSKGKRLRDQLDSLAAEMKKHAGPLVFCGDFNTWSRARLDVLHEVTAELELIEVPKPAGQGCTVRLPWPLSSMVDLDDEMHLDRVFYRGLELVEQRWLDAYDVSDHLPLFARFRFE